MTSRHNAQPPPRRPARLAGLGALLLGLALIQLTGCEDFTDDPGPSSNCNVPPALSCTSCHGDSERGDPAPPSDARGRTATSEVTVGAHQAHLWSSTWRRDLACEECHRVPDAVNAPGHIDGGPAELAFGLLAAAGDASPLWNRSAATCEGVYCHGATLGGGTHPNPVWTQVDGSQSACGSCHSLPPPAPHTPSTRCADCHGTVVNAARDFVDPTLHINGQVELSYTGCSACHGSDANAAPPTDTAGHSDTALVTVGAHQAHLAPAPWRRALECSDCHQVPASVDDPGHLDPGPAEVTFSALARLGGSNPTFDRAATTCAGVYCHGVSLFGPIAGGTVSRTPLWTVVDGTYSECGTTCHTLPPGGDHPAESQCEQCHGSSITSFDAANPAASTWASPSRHINGTVNF